MTPEMIGKQENTNQKRRMELTLDLINARVSLSGQQRNQIREILREKFSAAIEEEREACAKIADREYVSIQTVTMDGDDPEEGERDCCGEMCLMIRDEIRGRSGVSSQPPSEDIRDLEALRHDNEILRQRLNEAIERYQDLLRGKPDERGCVNIST